MLRNFAVLKHFFLLYQFFIQKYWHSIRLYKRVFVYLIENTQEPQILPRLIDFKKTILIGNKTYYFQNFA